jgi:hypothetical protein
VQCRLGESNSSSATDPVAFAECSPSNNAELRVDGLALGDEFAMNIAVDVEKHDEHVFVELRLSLTFGCRDGLFYCNDFVSGSYPWLVAPPFCP